MKSLNIFHAIVNTKSTRKLYSVHHYLIVLCQKESIIIVAMKYHANTTQAMSGAEH